MAGGEQKGQGMKKILIINTMLFVLIACASASATDKGNNKVQKKPADQLAKATTDLVSAANQYKASVQALIPIYEREVNTATATLETRRGLYAQGIISRRDLEASEQAVKEAQARLDESRKHITESDQLVAEAKAEQELAKRVVVPSRASNGYTATSTVMRYGGAGGWSLSQATQVQGFFASKFGRQLPVSAYGQTATHNRMGFNHRNSVDVAVHPDSAEGRALIAYLRSAGIPFIAFRSAVAGAATGAHIHIGYPSSRL
jgi:hypothetical protein